MANNKNSAPVLSLDSFLQKEKLSYNNFVDWQKLSGTNFRDWYHNLRIVLEQEQLLYALDARVPDVPDVRASRAEKNLYEKHASDSRKASCLMLIMMTPYLQGHLELLEAYDMITSLKKMFDTQARHERYNTTRALVSCKMVEGTSVSTHVLKMKSYIDYLNWLGSSIDENFATDIILVTLSKSFDQFVDNYIMNDVDKSVLELHEMLITAEKHMKARRRRRRRRS